MALVESTQYGNLYKWGFLAADAPSINANFTPRNGDLKIEPEVTSTATDGEGHAESITRTKQSLQKLTFSVSGYITPTFDAGAISASFSWTPSSTLGSRFFIISDISEPIKKGEYTEVTVSATSVAGVTSSNSA